MFLLKIGLRPWRAAPISQTMSAFAGGALLILFGLLYWFQDALKPIIGRLRTEQVITAYLDPALSAEEEKRTVDSIRVSLGAEAISDLRTVQGQDFLNNLRQEYPDLAQQLLNLGGQLQAVLPRFVSVSGVFPPASADLLKSLPGVERVETTRNRFQYIADAFSVIRWVAKLLIAGIFVALLTTLLHLGKINLTLQAETLRLVRLLGGGFLATRVPALISGLSVGLAGGILAQALWASFAFWAATKVQVFSTLFSGLALPTATFGWLLLLIGSAMGAVVGVTTGLFGGSRRN